MSFLRKINATSEDIFAEDLKHIYHQFIRTLTKEQLRLRSKKINQKYVSNIPEKYRSSMLKHYKQIDNERKSIEEVLDFMKDQWRKL